MFTRSDIEKDFNAEKTESRVLVAGTYLFIYFIRDLSHDFWRGLGLAFAVIALHALTADYFAERRGRVYTGGLASFVQ